MDMYDLLITNGSNFDSMLIKSLVSSVRENAVGVESSECLQV